MPRKQLTSGTRRVRRGRRTGVHAAPEWTRPEPPFPYPDYVTCPHCGEPEIEVWSDKPAAHCHNCGRTFAHPLATDHEPEGSGAPTD